MTSGGNSFNDFPENQRTSKGQSGNKSVSLFVYAGLEWSDDGHRRTNSTDVFSLPQDHLLNRKAAVLHFTRVYTVGLQHAITKYWQKAVCITNQTVTYCSFRCNTVSRLINVQFTGRKIGIKNPCPPPNHSLNDAPEWGSTLSHFLCALQPISNCYFVSW